MKLSRLQTEYLHSCKNGIEWKRHLNRELGGVMHYLMDCGLVAPREDISSGLILITKKGIAELEQIENEENIRKQREQAQYEQAQSEAIKTEQYIAEERTHDVKVAGLTAILSGIFGNIQYLIDLY